VGSGCERESLSHLAWWMSQTKLNLWRLMDLFSWRGDSSPMTRLRREMTMVEVELIPTKPEGQQDW